MLEFNNVSKIFGDIVALSDISFDVEPGELVYITGPSGAGKTTLLKLLVREFLPTSGEIIFDGENLSSIKKRKIPLLRRKVGAVFQDYRMLNDRTVRENCEVILAINQVPKANWIENVDAVLGLVGLSERAALFPSQLSGGELQRATLARALVSDPILIFADEPTGNLDKKTANSIMNLLRKINENGKTVIVTTHDIDLIDKSKSRLMEMEGGKLVSDSKKKKKKEK